MEKSNKKIRKQEERKKYMTTKVSVKIPVDDYNQKEHKRMY
jgi:hypothetical protein